MRAVVDTNVWISSLLSRRGAPARIAAAAGDRLTPVFTRSTFDELMRVASSERLVKRGLAPELFEVLAQRLLAVGEFIPEPPVTSITRDADDDVFVAAAVAGHAEFLVSGDGDLRDDPPVRGFLAERGVRIVTVREFVEILRESDSLG